ncbi:MAG: S46 family peptidase [Bacteroidales bacterium]|nr:S46 family peptidase [Bacteroidales bacterium]
MKRFWILSLLLAGVLLPAGLGTPARADEGMWIPMLLNRNETDMQSKGLQLSADDIYSINHSSLKDAVVIFGGGCTGEVVSDRGLLFTNHHCGFGQIQYHSSLEHDYLTNGFWAASEADELPCPGLSVTFLVRMEDVTEAMLGGLPEGLGEKERADSVRQRMQALKEATEAGTHYRVRIVPFYYGNQYYMFVNEVFEDVRLVGTPPSNIGKFGGDTDNWMWPRHTGDFSVFRIYADSNNQPAPYSADNQPYRPRQFFPISLRGLNPGDFTFVFGYPGRTQEYLSSYAVHQVAEVENPIRIAARTRRLDVIKAAMNADPLTRIQYAAKAASIANGWKKWIGESKGIARLKTVAAKQAFEKDFTAWTMTDEGAAYRGVLPALEAAYQALEPYNVMSVMLQEIGMAPELLSIAYAYGRLAEAASADGFSDSAWQAGLDALHKRAELFYKNYDPRVDEDIFRTLLAMNHEEMAVEPDAATQKDLYAKSLFVSADKAEALLNTPYAKRKNFIKTVENDVACKYARLIYGQYLNQVRPTVARLSADIDSLQRLYMQGQMAMQPERRFYPDANFTLRVTYGQIKGFSPADAVHYAPFTTIDGIMAKENPDIYDYVVEDRLKELYAAQDFGPYADSAGRLPVAFIATNHTTGGNSGSPVLNGRGELIGLNFDRNWEGTMSDIHYDPTQCRNITLDIRYCLFIIDKFAGAQRLIDELEIRR